MGPFLESIIATWAVKCEWPCKIEKKFQYSQAMSSSLEFYHCFVFRSVVSFQWDKYRMTVYCQWLRNRRIFGPLLHIGLFALDFNHFLATVSLMSSEHFSCWSVNVVQRRCHGIARACFREHVRMMTDIHLFAFSSMLRCVKNHVISRLFGSLNYPRPWIHSSICSAFVCRSKPIDVKSPQDGEKSCVFPNATISGNVFNWLLFWATLRHFRWHFDTQTPVIQSVDSMLCQELAIYCFKSDDKMWFSVAQLIFRERSVRTVGISQITFKHINIIFVSIFNKKMATRTFV